MARFREVPSVLTMAATCHKCGRAVSVRLVNPSAATIDATQRNAVCLSCWLRRSIANPRGRGTGGSTGAGSVRSAGLAPLP